MADADQTKKARKLIIRFEYSPQEEPVWAVYTEQKEYIGYLTQEDIQEIFLQYHAFPYYKRTT